MNKQLWQYIGFWAGLLGIAALLLWAVLGDAGGRAGHAGNADPVPAVTGAVATPQPVYDTPLAYFQDGTFTDVTTLMQLITAQHAALPEAQFFTWLHEYLRQVRIEGTMWVRTADAPTGSVSWLQGDSRPQIMFVGCLTAVPLGYHRLTLTTSNVACLNGECLLMAMPESVDGR